MNWVGLSVLKQKFRGMSSEEEAILSAALLERKKVAREYRGQIEAPECTNQSIAAATNWAITVMWQDTPGILVLGIAGLTFAAGVQCYDLWKYVEVIISR
ncbi:hypothetical protein [Azonexus hydrophilus]|uniref:Uncharacterized protein n=1 Tax=Azonexus hydrophilus TaxID=418702 RepID=A0ABZ2XQ05_9RHOO